MDAEARRRILEEEQFRRSLQSKNKALGLILTFFFPVLGFLYITNYVWAVIFLIIDFINFALMMAMGIGFFSGLLTRIFALFIANYGIDRYRGRKVAVIERELAGTGGQPKPQALPVNMGAVPSSKFCSSCGAQVSPDSKFCSECGMGLV